MKDLFPQEKPEVLIVDDDEALCRSMLKILGARHIPAHAVNSGEAAVEELVRKPYDVVLLDVKMPGISGIGVMKEMRRRGITAEVVVLSGHASLETAVEIVECGAYDYLLKPSAMDEILLKISGAFDQKREKDKVRQPGPGPSRS
ncbi:MAG: response regulator [Thermodesulfobacteriota bacterium]